MPAFISLKEKMPVELVAFSIYILLKTLTIARNFFFLEVSEKNTNFHDNLKFPQHYNLGIDQEIRNNIIHSRLIIVHMNKMRYLLTFNP